jgi:hypothetical protein
MATKDVTEYGSQSAPSARGSKVLSPEDKLAPSQAGAPSTKAVKKDKASNSKGKLTPSKGGAKAKGRRDTEGHVPNDETIKVLRDIQAGKGLLRYESLEEMYKNLGM